MYIRVGINQKVKSKKKRIRKAWYKRIYPIYSRSVIDCYLKSSHGKFDSVVKLAGEFMRLTNRQISNYGKKEGTTRRIEKIFGRIYGRN